jgi:hypothetical protein
MFDALVARLFTFDVSTYLLGYIVVAALLCRAFASTGRNVR